MKEKEKEKERYTEGGTHGETERGKEGMRGAQGNQVLVERMLAITVLRRSVGQVGQWEKKGGRQF